MTRSRRECARNHPTWPTTERRHSRSHHTRRTLSLSTVLIMAAYSCPTSRAFVMDKAEPLHRVSSSSPLPPRSSQQPLRGVPLLLPAPLAAVNGGSSRIFWDHQDAKEDTQKEDERARWMQWMMGGKPRGTSKVILREAEELGGVPRNDRYSSRDWLHSAITLPNSGVLKSIRSPVLAVTAWACFLSFLHRRLLATNPAAAAKMYLPSAPHTLMMSVLGLLLVFRTNSAYARFNEGRKVWEDIINTSRDLYRMMMLYEQQIGFAKRRRLQKLLAAFPYLLRHRIRPNLVMRRLDDQKYPREPEHTLLLYQDEGPTDDDPELAALATVEEETGLSRRKQRPLFWVDKRTLPWRLLPSGALEKCARAQNRPLWVCDRMAQELREVPDQETQFTNRERLALITHVDKLSRCIGGAERIHQTSVPLNYARHTLRALTIWLFSLPLVLVKDLRMWTGPVLFFLSWMLWGVYEIGVKVEDPFQGTLRLSILCDMIRRDVLGDEHIRSSAFRTEESIRDKEKAAARAAAMERNSNDMETSFE
uniref:Bestrophin homolog n=1 Tax=Amphora coffeiformis TaxID=265554 RepID=A0A7S3LDL3_9STRA